METALYRSVAATTSQRRERALARAHIALGELSRKGVTAGIIGSLATTRFRPHSDVDFLVVDCPPELRYAIEAALEGSMDDIGFDVVYLYEVDANARSRMLAEVKYGADL